MSRGNSLHRRSPHGFHHLVLSIVVLLANSGGNLANGAFDNKSNKNNHIRRREHVASWWSRTNGGNHHHHDGGAAETTTTETTTTTGSSRALISPPRTLSCQPHVTVDFTRNKFFSVLRNGTFVNSTTLFDGVNFRGRINGNTDEEEDAYEDAAIFSLGGSQGNTLMLAHRNDDGAGTAPAAEGGEIRAEFEDIGTLQFLKFLQIDKSIHVDFHDASGALIETKTFAVSEGDAVVPSHIMAPQLNAVKSMKITLEGRALLDDVAFNRTCPSPEPVCFPFQLIDFERDDNFQFLEDGDAVRTDQRFAGIKFRARLREDGSEGDILLDELDDGSKNAAYIQTVPTPDSDLYPLPGETNTLIVGDASSATPMQPSPNGGVITAKFDRIGNQMGQITLLNVEKRLEVELFDKKGRRRVRWLQMIDGMLDLEVISFAAPEIKSIQINFGGRGALEKVEFSRVCDTDTPPSSSPGKGPPSLPGNSQDEAFGKGPPAPPRVVTKTPPAPSPFFDQAAPPQPTPSESVDNIMAPTTPQSSPSSSSSLPPYLCKPNVTIDFKRYGLVFRNDTLVNPTVKYDTGVTFRAKRNGGNAFYDNAYIIEMEGKQGAVLVISNNGENSAGKGGEILAEFESPVTVESLRFLELEKTVTMEYYDESGDLIGAPTMLEIPPDETLESVKEKVNVDGVKSIKIFLEGRGALDDVSFRRESCEDDNDDEEDASPRCHFSELIDFSTDMLGNPLSNGTFVDPMTFHNVQFRVKREGSPTYTPALIYTVPTAKRNTLAIAGAKNEQKPAPAGGMIVAEFDPPVRVDRLNFVKAQKTVGVELLDAKGELLLSWQQRLRGMVESSPAEFHISNVTTMNIRLGGQGAIDNLWFYFETCSEEDGEDDDKVPTQVVPPSPVQPSLPPSTKSPHLQSPSLSSPGECDENIVIDFEKDARGVVLQKGALIDQTIQFEGGATFKARRREDEEDSFVAGMIFDAATVTGDDHDLFSPSNRNVFIISEDLESSDPDDNAKGGWIVANFTRPVRIKEITLMDIDSLSTRIDLFGGDDATMLESISIQTLPDGATQVVPIGVDHVRSFVIAMSGSGAMDEVSFFRPCPTPI